MPIILIGAALGAIAGMTLTDAIPNEAVAIGLKIGIAIAALGVAYWLERRDKQKGEG